MPEKETVVPTLTEEQKGKLLATGSLFTTLAGDPKYRKRVLGLIKEADPSTVIPELDMEADLDAKVDAKVKPHLDTIKSLADKTTALERELARRSWAEQHGLSEEEVVEIETLAKDKGISKADTAIEFWRQGQQLGVPRATPRAGGDEDYAKELAKIGPKNGPGLKAAAQRQALKVLQGLRGRRAG